MLGAVSIVFGLVMLLWPGLSLEVLVIIVGIWAIVVGILQIVVSVGHRGVPRQRLGLGSGRRHPDRRSSACW